MRNTGRNAIFLVPLLAGLLISSSVARSQSGFTLTGNVNDQSGGGVQGALVRLYSARGLRETRADFDGAFEFLHVDPGKYELEVKSPGFFQVAQDIEISDRAPAPKAITLRVGFGGHCVVRGSREGERFFSPGTDNSYIKRTDKVDVKGLVRDDLGVALAGVAVKLEGMGLSLSAVSNGSGEFEFSGVEPGKYILTSKQGGFWDISRYLWIMQENQTKVMVTLPDKIRVPCFEGSGPS